MNVDIFVNKINYRVIITRKVTFLCSINNNQRSLQNFMIIVFNTICLIDNNHNNMVLLIL